MHGSTRLAGVKKSYVFRPSASAQQRCWLGDCTVVAGHRALRQFEKSMQYFVATSRYRQAFFHSWQYKTHRAKNLFGSCLKTNPAAGGQVPSLPRTQTIRPLWLSPSGPLGVCNPNEKPKSQVAMP